MVKVEEGRSAYLNTGQVLGEDEEEAGLGKRTCGVDVLQLLLS